jgi:leader peptidase (prepilin peptidase)/N-methyltransferase
MLDEPAILIAAAALLGLIVGSFLNVVIHRVPRMLEAEWRAQCEEMAGREPAPQPAYNLLVPRSHCPACQTPVRALHLIPILGWFLARGRCAACGAAVSPRYPIVEALTAVLFALAAVKFGAGWPLAGALLLIAFLVALAFIDLDTQFLPDQLTLPLVWAGLAMSLFLGPPGDDPAATGGASGGIASTLPPPLADAVLGAIAGYLVLWVVHHAFRLATGKEGMGYGDFKLLAALGAWLGWQTLLPIVLVASVAGALVGIALMVLKGHGRDHPIPFGPFLAVAGWIVLMWGDALLPAALRGFGG